jgi:putative peptidoglycan lipid II flippase
LAAYALGLPAFVMVKVLAPGFFARGDTATPVKIGLASVVLNLLLNLAFMAPLQWVGPALATSLAAMVNVALLGVVLARRRQLALDATLRHRVPRMIGASAIMAVVLWLGERSLYAPLALHGWRWIALGLLIALGLASYFVAAHLLGAVDLRLAGATLLRRRPRPAGT